MMKTRALLFATMAVAAAAFNPMMPVSDSSRAERFGVGGYVCVCVCISQRMTDPPAPMG
jgi:hypothetical protein